MTIHESTKCDKTYKVNTEYQMNPEMAKKGFDGDMFLSAINGSFWGFYDEFFVIEQY